MSPPTGAVVSFWLLLSATLISSFAEEFDSPLVNYDNFTLYRVWSTDSAFRIDDGFHNSLVLSEATHRSQFYDLIVPPESDYAFKADLMGRHVKYDTLSANVQEVIEEERKLNQMDTRNGQPYSWERYMSYEETNEWMQELADKYPQEVTLYNLGKSHQRRDIYALKLSRRANNSAVFIEAGVHAREWIAPATSTWIFNNLLTSEDPRVKQLSSDYDWYLVPLVNPDGYVMTTRANRMWRKNMRRSVLCQGVDVNRNWGYHWREAGSSSFACSDQYAGPSAMSEPETRHLDSFMKTIANQVKLYLSFHAYSQLLLWPEGHTSERIAEFDDYERIGKATVDAIAVRYGTEYDRGSIIEAIYPASGSTIDYMRATYKIPLAFCFELRPSRNQEGIGFILDPAQIVPTGEETFDGIAAMVEEGHALGYL